MMRYIVERTNQAEIRPEEQNEKEENLGENVWNDRNRHKNRKKEW